ncbi:MAG TPA: hypothetical protein VF104_01255 [Burkholderiales bacterium]
MTASKTTGLTVRNGTAGTTGSVAGDQSTQSASRPSAGNRCDRAWRIQLMREAYVALLRKERAPVA